MLARRAAWFGLIAAMSSSFGQTFFIGLFGESFREAFALSEAGLGILYGGATLVAGLSMFWLGEVADRFPMRHAVTGTLGLVTTGALLVATATGAVQLVIGILLLRLGGQGLTGHLAIVAAARFGGQRRGRGVATAAMGFIVGEASFPILVVAALQFAEWRTVWGVVALITLVGFTPVLRALARPLPAPVVVADADRATEAGGWTRRRLFSSVPFLATLGVVLISPLVVTAVFFHQTALGARIGWTQGAVAVAFMIFAACQAVATLAAGRLTDRFDARALLRFYPLPVGLGLLAALWAAPVPALWLLFAGLGVTAGANSVVAGAVWVELFGSERLGLIRGVYAAVMVISTAVSPALLGLALSAGLTLAQIFIPVVVYVVVAPWLLAPLTRVNRRAFPASSGP